MKIRMLVAMAGTDGTAHAGQVIDRPEKEARELVGGGYAVEVLAEKKPAPAPAAPPAKPSDGKPGKRAGKPAPPPAPDDTETKLSDDDDDEDEQE